MLDPFLVMHKGQNKMLMIVPHRDREHHLIPFMNKTIRYFNSDKVDRHLDVHMVIAHQTPGKPFNRGGVINAAVFLFLDEIRPSHLCFHDVDTIPEIGDYRYSEYAYVFPKVHSNRSIYTPVTIMDPKIFKSVNGYCPHYWGWGSEDMDLHDRWWNRFRKGGDIELRSWTRFLELSHPHSSLDTAGNVLPECHKNFHRFQNTNFHLPQPGLNETIFTSSEAAQVSQEGNVTTYQVDINLNYG